MTLKYSIQDKNFLTISRSKFKILYIFICTASYLNVKPLTFPFHLPYSVHPFIQAKPHNHPGSFFPLISLYPGNYEVCWQENPLIIFDLIPMHSYLRNKIAFFSKHIYFECCFYLQSNVILIYFKILNENHILLNIMKYNYFHFNKSQI